MHRLPGVVNNVRFLILPGVHIPNLASRILAANLRRLGGDWQRPYGRPVFLAETFVDAARFRGTCYRASNWLYLGDTRGFSRRGAHYTPNGAPKRVFAPGRNVAVAGERSPPAPDQEGIKLLRRRLFALTVVGITSYTHDHEDYRLDPRRALPPD
jgi:hypothetical protein